MLKSSIKLWGGKGEPYGTDKTGSLRLLCETPCALTYLDDEDVFLFYTHQKNGNAQKEEGEEDAAAAREWPKKK